jgi:hypothetical protein
MAGVKATDKGIFIPRIALTAGNTFNGVSQLDWVQ